MFRVKSSPEDVFRLKFRQRFRSDLERIRDERLKAGRFPFEGAWRSLDEIMAMRGEMKRRDRRVLLELMALFLGMTATIAFLRFLMGYILPR